MATNSIDEAVPRLSQHDACGIPHEVGPAERLPDGRPKLRGSALRIGQEERARPESGGSYCASHAKDRESKVITQRYSSPLGRPRSGTKAVVAFAGPLDASARGTGTSHGSGIWARPIAGYTMPTIVTADSDAGRMLSITLKETWPRLILIVAVVATLFVVVATVVVVAPVVIDAITIHARPVNRPIIVAVISVVVTVIAAITTVIAERNA